MSPRSVNASLLFLLCLFSNPSNAQVAAPAPPSDTPPASSNPTLLHRPPPKPPSKTVPDGKMFLDVVVNDAVGNPVSGLEPWDFKLVDNGHPAKIQSFRSFGGPSIKPDPPVEVILLVDEVNLSFSQVSYIKSELADFLAQNGSHLAQPISIIVLTETGIRVQPRPSTDGLALRKVVNQIAPHISSINSAMGIDGALERTQISTRELASIAENEAHKPGRKLLVWIGPGWPMLQSPNFKIDPQNRHRYFDVIVELTNRLREARVVLYSVSPIDSSMGSGAERALQYKAFLQGVRSAKDADADNLGLKVLVTNSGGRILGPDNNLVSQINQCIADANAFYRLSFDPPIPDHPDEFRDLQVLVNKPSLIVRTNSGYYNEPPGR